MALSGLFSGLTIGFFSLNKDDLKRKADLGDWQARRVYNIRKEGNFLLCTLLIGNVAVNTALSIFLGSVTSGFLGGVIATVLIVVLGEIAPQATFARYALVLGSYLAPLVRFFELILLPICWPLGKLLDAILGEEVAGVYSRRELVRLIEEHEDHHESDLDADEEMIIKGALSYSSKRVWTIMTPRKEVYTVCDTRLLNEDLYEEIRHRGKSRIPVWSGKPTNITGVLYTKDLIGLVTGEDKRIVKDITRSEVFHVDENQLLDEVLNSFKRTHHHLFMVISKQSSFVGVVTIEDVLEEIIGAEIIDEFDDEAS